MSTASNPKPATPESLDQVEVFRPGKRRAINGEVYEITAADVVALAEAYDPALHRAPHVVGHPKSDNPAYGWVESLQAVDGGNSLVVTKSGQVDAAFAELVTSGRFPNRSIAFYPPQHEANPKPGVWYPKHIGWLGAAAPAVKGLKPVAAFAGSEAGLVEFGEWEDQLQVGIFRRLREWFIGRFGVEEADKVLPSYELDALQREALKPEPDDTRSLNPIGFAEGDNPVPTPNDQAALDKRAAELDAREAAVQQRENAQATLVANARKAGIAAFAETMIAEGRWLPAEKGRWVAFMEALPAEAAVVEFAEGDPDKKSERPALEVFQEQMRKAPKVVAFGEHAGNERGGEAVDMTKHTEIARAAVEFQEAEKKAGRTVEFEAAVQHIVNTHKDAQ
ncbi:MAG TPA: hypothetical protein VIN58_01045 [Roseateles sp.]